MPSVKLKSSNVLNTSGIPRSTKISSGLSQSLPSQPVQLQVSLIQAKLAAILLGSDVHHDIQIEKRSCSANRAAATLIAAAAPGLQHFPTACFSFSPVFLDHLLALLHLPFSLLSNPLPRAGHAAAAVLEHSPAAVARAAAHLQRVVAAVPKVPARVHHALARDLVHRHAAAVTSGIARLKSKKVVEQKLKAIHDPVSK